MLSLLACVNGPPSASDVAVSDAPPNIVSAKVTCDPAAPKWKVAVATDAWTGNGQVWMTVDGHYVEKHPMYSDAAAQDGTSDHLALSLSMQPDIHRVSEGSSTYFNCDEPGLHGILLVLQRNGKTVADCRSFTGEATDWVAWDVGVACEETLEVDSG